MSSFAQRLQEALSEYGGVYDPVMRRSFQTVLMFEANRCLKDKLPTLRPFQRKLAVFDQAKYLLEEISGESSLVGLDTQGKREEIMWRTGTSREPLNPESMWSRASRLSKDVEKVAEQVEEFMKGNTKITSTSTHEEIYRSFVESIYDKAHPNVQPGTEVYPIQFEYTHSHLFLAYKVYYRKGKIDPEFPEPRAREINVPREKPTGGLESYNPILPAIVTAASANNAVIASKMSGRPTSKVARIIAPAIALRESPLIVAAGQKASAAAAVAAAHVTGANLSLNGRVSEPRHNQQQNHMIQDVPTIQQQDERRRRELLREVKDHMELLSQFEGIIDSETLKKRKRDLFLSVPPPPPPNEKQEKKSSKKSNEGQGSGSETESDDDKNTD
mmetsp:Transcript_25036/g.54900  ORF Transcript_25036/g.54900 Transcript_25036/m.54900 type:complete len:387 (+) Transcript_25036:162-1322(+)